MSTNYYIKRIPNIDDVITVQQAINSITPENIQEVLKEQQEYIEEKSQYIHLGKRSVGWKFNWELWNNKYYKCSIKSIKEFLNQKINEGWIIINEYKEKFSVDEFFEEIHDWLYYDEGQTGSSDVVYDDDAKIELRFTRSQDFR